MAPSLKVKLFNNDGSYIETIRIPFEFNNAPHVLIYEKRIFVKSSASIQDDTEEPNQDYYENAFYRVK